MKKILSAIGLAFSLWCVLVSPVAVLAESDNINISGEVPSSIVIDVPDDITLDSMVPGTVVTSDVQTVTVTSNATTWSLKVAEYEGDSDGKMAQVNFHPMTNPLQVKGGDTGYSSLASIVTLKASGSGSMSINDIYFQQVVASNEAPGTYSITVVFTVTTGA